MGNSVAAVYDRLLALCGLLAGSTLALLAFAITVDIVLRNAGILNFPWLLEVAEYVIYVATFLAAPWVLNRAAHVRVDVFVNVAPKPMATVMELAADLIGMATCATFAWYSLNATSISLGGSRLIYKELVIPEWPLLAVMPFAGVLLAIEFARRLRRTWIAGGDMKNRMTDGL
ncbi:MAG: TRAP transporter small permease [Alphaproteobacteria bacterium]|nr:TRAP transporter small permease [Alphaproteobacteria bacterium]